MLILCYIIAFILAIDAITLLQHQSAIRIVDQQANVLMYVTKSVATITVPYLTGIYSSNAPVFYPNHPNILPNNFLSKYL